jgi:hypothetical protein
MRLPPLSPAARVRVAPLASSFLLASAIACAAGPAAQPTPVPEPARTLPPAPAAVAAARPDRPTASRTDSSVARRAPAPPSPPAAAGSMPAASARSAATPRTAPAPTATIRLATVPRSRVPVARASARNDTIVVRSLRGPVGVCAGGDVTLGTNLDREWSRAATARMRARYGLADDPATLLAPLGLMVRDADIVLVNVESAIGAGDTPSKCGPRSTHCFAFRSPPAAAPALRRLASGTVVGNVANNHARDAGDAGVDSTVAALRRAGVLVTGVDTLATPVPTPAGDTIGVLGFYTSADTPDARDTAAVFRQVARAARRYPVVIVTMHLGAEGRAAQRTLDQEELFLRIDRGNPVAFADAAVRGGAALVIGHGPHVLRGMEWREGGALVAYSLGNLLTYGPFVLGEPLNRAALLCATLGRDGRVRSAALRPTRQLAPGLVTVDSTGRAIVLVDSLSRLDFPATGVTGETDGRLRPRARKP